MSDVFEEVEESIRKDKLTEFWSKWSVLFWVSAFIVLASVGFMELSKSQKTQATNERILVFEKARELLAAGDYADAQESFIKLIQGETDISPLAAQYLAKAYYEGNGDGALAAETLEAAFKNNGPIERIGFLKAAYLKADTLTLTELEVFLGDLPSEPTALGALALELVAAKAFKEGDVQRARKEFGYLRFAPDAPPGVVQRAEVALSVLPVLEPDQVSPEVSAEMSLPPPTVTAIERSKPDEQEGSQ